jgi:hypothetical protein
MANPNINQGILNRLLTSLSVTGNPGLNVTAPYLGKGGIVWTPQGQATIPLPTLTGLAMSPEPYMQITVHMSLLKSQALCESYLQQIELNTLLGDCVFRSDSSAIGSRTLSNTAIEGFNEITSNGQVIEVVFALSGIWNINSQLYSAL